MRAACSSQEHRRSPRQLSVGRACHRDGNDSADLGAQSVRLSPTLGFGGGVVIVQSSVPDLRKRRPANIYRAIAPLVRLARAPRDLRNRKVMASIVRSTAAHAAREYGEAFAGSEWRIEGPQRNRWFFRLHPAPSRPKLARFNALLV